MKAAAFCCSPAFFFFLTRLQKLRLVVTLPPYQTGLLHLRCCPHQLQEVFPVGVTAETPLGSSAAASGTKKTPQGMPGPRAAQHLQLVSPSGGLLWGETSPRVSHRCLGRRPQRERKTTSRLSTDPGSYLPKRSQAPPEPP